MYNTHLMASTWLPAATTAKSGCVQTQGSYGTGAKSPSLYQLFDGFYGNAALKPERSTGYDVGIEQTFLSGDARVDVTWFNNRVSNLIDWLSTGQYSGSYFNVNRAHISGTEVSAE